MYIQLKFKLKKTSNKDRDFYEIKWRFGSKNKPSAFIPLFIVTLHTKYQTDDLKFTINDETDERTY
ncbi:hypothetical protein F3F27_10205 [Bacteroides ovatus]|uniref:Uncharacterized protein n=2 Tax=Bacteroides TaxID=816 RepID=A0A1Y4PBF6_BACOV|nr:hypothetical protein HMPREF0102_01823 [Bacteroides sp. 2_1_22]KAA3799028.1 hypothetical protein F3F97_05165 [Bacteroides ovatus]KAB4179517.1 hypothetical protein GAQ34_22580 [Bacteroides uniformis]RGE80599.1 hypothetical protein DXA11_14920 [Bacteroides sp. AM56-10ce]RGE82041.1 hypothetical protein DWZ47_00550 [Bacteroides sp. AF32-8BH]